MKFLNCFPTKAIDAMPLSYENPGGLYPITAEFRADYFEDIFN
jgi:hypothetical protein